MSENSLLQISSKLFEADWAFASKFFFVCRLTFGKHNISRARHLMATRPDWSDPVHANARMCQTRLDGTLKSVLKPQRALYCKAPRIRPVKRSKPALNYADRFKHDPKIALQAELERWEQDWLNRARWDIFTLEDAAVPTEQHVQRYLSRISCNPVAQFEVYKEAGFYPRAICTGAISA